MAPTTKGWRGKTSYQQFVLTPKWMILCLASVAIVFLPLGIGFYVNNEQLKDLVLDYTKCPLDAPKDGVFAPNSDESFRWRYDPVSRNCSLEFYVPSAFSGTVYMYIRLTNFYQNHRLYLTSQNVEQLQGKVFSSAADLNVFGETDCSWLTYANCQTAASKTWTTGNGLTYAQSNPDCLLPLENRSAVITNANLNAQYYPCGLVANSMFSDEISSLACQGSACPYATYTFSERGIAWKQDAGLYGPTGWASDPNLAPTIPTNLIPPPAWRKAWPNKWGNGYNSSNLPDLVQWERFQVWMRKAGLPTFRKLWGRNDDLTLEKGTYRVNVTYTFDVLRFSGTKSLVFSRVGILGIRNDFIPISFLVVGSVSGFMALLIYFWRVRKLADHSFLSWVRKAEETQKEKAS